MILQDIPRKTNEFITRVVKEQANQYYEDLMHLYHIVSEDQEMTLEKAAIIATTDIQLVALPYGEEKEYTTEDAVEKLTPVAHTDPLFIPSVIIQCQTEFLAWKSEYFKVAILGSFSEAEEIKKEREQGSVPQFKLYNSSEAALEQLIRYTYTGYCLADAEIASELLFHALQFEMDGLLKLVEDYIIENSHEFDGVDVLMMADLVNNEKMRNVAVREIISKCKLAMKRGETVEEVEQKLRASEIPENELVAILQSL
jgi:hypothetical protein